MVRACSRFSFRNCLFKILQKERWIGLCFSATVFLFRDLCRVNFSLNLSEHPPRFAGQVPVPPSRALRSTTVVSVASALYKHLTIGAGIELMLSALLIREQKTEILQQRELSFFVETPRAASNASWKSLRPFLRSHRSFTSIMERRKMIRLRVEKM